MKVGKIILTLLLLAAVGGGLLLVKQNQDVRKGAAAGVLNLFISPGTRITKKVGEKLSYVISYSGPANSKVETVQTKVCYGPEIVFKGATGVTANGFRSVALSKTLPTNSAGLTCTFVTVVADDTATTCTANLKDAGQAITLNFDAVKKGGPRAITLVKEDSRGTIYAPGSAEKLLDGNITGNGEYEITDGVVVPTGDPVLNYMVSYYGIRPNDHKCLVDWPLQLIVQHGDQNRKAYNNIIPQEVIDKEDRVVFKGSVPLKDFAYTDSVSALFKGSKHLQMKYYKNKQSEAAGKYTGEITMTNDPATSPWYDFTDYPILPGDVVGKDSEEQDGEVNGIDFIYVKNQSAKLVTVADGQNLKGDLDGNCQVNTNDVNLLRLTLAKKQGQLY